MHKSKNTIQNYQQTRTHTTIQTIIQMHYLQHHTYQISIITIHYHLSHEILGNLAITNPPNLRPSHVQSPIQHMVTEYPQNDDTYEQIFEQPQTTTFQSQNNHFFSPR